MTNPPTILELADETRCYLSADLRTVEALIARAHKRAHRNIALAGASIPVRSIVEIAQGDHRVRFEPRGAEQGRDRLGEQHRPSRRRATPQKSGVAR